jgi:putative transposase
MTLRLTLTDTDRDAVRALRHDRTIRPAERDRVEMVLLADGGWSAPRIAGHLACQAATVRGVLKRLVADGLPSLRRRSPGPSPDPARRLQVETALTALLGEDRTWTAAQLATALAVPHGITLSTRQTRKERGRIAAWRRTVRSLRHKQDPAKAAHAAQQLARLEVQPRRVRFG